jgi:hypothetical protein
MASPSLRYRDVPHVSHLPIRALHLLLLISLSLAAVLWGSFLISGQHGGDTVKYLLLLGPYAIASAAFIFSRIRGNHLKFFDIPVFLTILVLVEFGLAPLECFVSPGQLNYNFDGNYAFLLKALLYVMVGMLAFWASCKIAERGTDPTEVQGVRSREQKKGRTQMRALPAAVGIYAVGFGVKVYLLTHHLYSYLGSEELYSQNLASMQVLMVVSGLGTSALVIACIERYLQPSDQKWKLLFAAMFASECFWGLISGMKSLLIQNFIIVALVSSLIQRRFRKGWIVAAVVSLILLYPISDAYRSVVRGHGEDVTSLSAAQKAGYDSLRRVRETESGTWSELGSGWRATVARMDLLQSVGLIMFLGPRAGLLRGDEQWWMLPIYPFIPRFIWHSKPILSEGGRFSVALGYGRPGATAWTVGTSTAVTYPGDLYSIGGLFGVIAGMFLLGIAAQWMTNGITSPLDEHRLFIYAGIFLTVTETGIDAFSFWSGCIRTFVILRVIAWLAYGPRRHESKVSVARRKAFRRP